MTLRFILGMLAAASLSGCSGKIVSYEDASAICDKGRCEGVLYHRLVPVSEVYYQDKIIDKDGNVVRHVGGVGPARCVAVQVEETKLVPAATASLITYEPGFLEISKFNVTLTPAGTLASAGAESTPGGKSAADALASIASTVKVLKVEADVLFTPEEGYAPYCNAGKIPADSPPSSVH